MSGFDCLVQPLGKFALAGQRAVPLALIIGDAADLPLRQFKVDQRQGCFGQGAGLDQLPSCAALAACSVDENRREVAITILGKQF